MPNKLLGVLAMLAGLLVLLVLPITDVTRNRGARFNPVMRSGFWTLLVVVFFLLYVGACHVANPWVVIGQILTRAYFGYFLVFVPALGTFAVAILELVPFLVRFDPWQPGPLTDWFSATFTLLKKRFDSFVASCASFV